MPAAKSFTKKTTKSVTAGAPGTGVYVGKVDVRNQTAEEVRIRFSAYGPISQVRVKRNQQGNGPYALIWFKSADDAKNAISELKKNEPEGTVVEPIKKAQPIQPTGTVNTTIVINPINVPSRSSKAYGKLAEKVKAFFPDAVKTRLLKEKDNTGTALVYFKDHAAATAATAKVGKTFFGQTVHCKPSLRSLAKDKVRFVEPLEHAAKFAAAKKAADEKKAKAAEDAKKAAAAAAAKKAADALAKKQAAEAAALADAKKKAAAKKAAADAAAKKPAAAPAAAKPAAKGKGAKAAAPAKAGGASKAAAPAKAGGKAAAKAAPKKK